ncbi:hypothetical protein APHAL10511_006073 [Amanita phalloides]|nr:hypothetical protein APHAL10511_006073 [Amanita phalloides]
MNRPRHSVLALFDPLAPDAFSPDHDYDKENSNSTPVFVPRSYRSRLVDISDTSIDNQDLPDTLVSSWPPRTPFAELTLRDADATPLAKTKAHAHDDLHNSSIPSPEIVISSCHSVDTRDIVSPSPFTELPQGDTSSLLLRTPSTSSCSNRLSMDLQAALQLHFKCDATFDLLNDNISLTEPMEPLMTDDDTFDFELKKENLQDAMAKFKRGPKTGVSQGKLAECESLSQENSDTTHESDKQTSETVSDRTSDTDSCCGYPGGTPDSPPPPGDLSSRQLFISPLASPVDDNLSKRQSIPSKLHSPTSYSSPKVLFPAPRQEAQSAVAQTKQRRLSAPLATPRRQPSIAPPPVVQALRIVKRTNAHHPPPASAGDANFRVAMNTASHASSASIRQTAEGSVPSTKARLSITIKPSVAPSRTVPGPRRVLCTEAPLGNATAKSKQTTLPTALGPRRMPVPMSKSLSITTGLKQPTRVEPVVSNLPRLSGLKASTSMSRLPAPGLSRLRRPAVGLVKRVISGE